METTIGGVRPSFFTKFKVQTIKDRQIITVKAYNEIADFVYSKLNIDEMVVINGYINEKHEIIVKEIMQ